MANPEAMRARTSRANAVRRKAMRWRLAGRVRRGLRLAAESDQCSMQDTRAVRPARKTVAQKRRRLAALTLRRRRRHRTCTSTASQRRGRRVAFAISTAAARVRRRARCRSRRPRPSISANGPSVTRTFWSRAVHARGRRVVGERRRSRSARPGRRACAACAHHQRASSSRRGRADRGLPEREQRTASQRLRVGGSAL